MSQEQRQLLRGGHQDMDIYNMEYASNVFVYAWEIWEIISSGICFYNLFHVHMNWREKNVLKIQFFISLYQSLNVIGFILVLYI